ncbi:hypothetical protein [uncultured Traorella sp.]|uniref:hypothetical protein n=1 Tax=uncultured Traorella sp. TaxID=1929048 RepID=UPI0025CE3164|nr:hypothetical protein [uncultured Traorella sp.]
MGRSGGGRSSGGGSRSGGGFRGGRSSGGFSRSRSSSGRSSFGRSSHSFHQAPPPPRPGRTVFIGGPRYRRPRYYRSGGSVFGAILAIIILGFVFVSLFGGLIFGGIAHSSSDVPDNTTQREPLVGVVNKTDWYEDELGWIRNRNVLIDGLEDFYADTGIQPYVVMINYSDDYWNGSSFDATAADNYLETLYEERFTDEGHFIFAYFSCLNDSEYEMEGEFRYLSGYAADSIMDNEAISILWGNFEKNYYDTSLSIEEMIGDTFKDTGESIMSRPTNGWDVMKIVVIAGGAVLIVFIIYKIIKSKHQREKEKEEYTKEILDKPLETFGTDTSDLEEKYGE